MPRKSAAALSVLQSMPVPKAPPPPRDFDPVAAKLWRAIAQDRPPDWFTPATLTLLRRFCRTAVYVERLNDALDGEPIGSKGAVVLFKQVVAANASLGILAAKMRLSTQATIDRRSAKAGERAGGKKPWEF